MKGWQILPSLILKGGIMYQKKMYKKGFLVPALVLYIALFVIPCVISFGYSFTNWNSMSDQVKFVGFDNFKKIFSIKGDYLTSVGHTLQFAFFSTILKSVFGLALALLLNANFRGKSFLRGLYFMPFAISPLIIGIVFTSVLHPQWGVLNEILRGVGLDFLAKNWLVDKSIAMFSVIGVETWREIGLNMVIFLAGLQMIDGTYYEAAEIDGAGFFSKLRYVIIPLLSSSIVVNTILNLIHGLRVFDIIFSLTGGGPGNTTEVLSTAVFRTYSAGAYGLSTALNVVVFIITTIIAVSTLKLITPKED